MEGFAHASSSTTSMTRRSRSCLAATHAARWIVDGARAATATSVGLQCRVILRQQPAHSQKGGQELEMRGRCSCELWLGALWPVCQSPSSLPFSSPIVPQAVRWASKQKPRIWSRRNSATQSTKRHDMVPSLRRGACSWRFPFPLESTDLDLPSLGRPSPSASHHSWLRLSQVLLRASRRPSSLTDSACGPTT